MTQSLITDAPHVKELVQALLDKVRATSLKHVEFTVAVNAELVGDLTKLTPSELVKVANISIYVLMRAGCSNEVIEKHRDFIEAMHGRHVYIADKQADGTFPITFHNKVSDIETTEYFKQYTSDPMDDVWKFFIYGLKPA